MTNRPKSLVRPWIPKARNGLAERPYDPFYHTARWKRASLAFIADNPLCADCQKVGKLTAANVTDHHIPKDICPDPWDITNWRPLCRTCHSKKSAKDKKHFKK